MKNLNSALFIAAISFQVCADGVVIVNLENKNQLDVNAVSSIFLGKTKSFPDGSQVIPVALVESDKATLDFNSKVLNRAPSQLKAYWAKLTFTGKGTAPKEVESAEDMIQLVKTNPNVIGYISSDKLDSSVKEVLRF